VGVGCPAEKPKEFFLHGAARIIDNSSRQPHSQVDVVCGNGGFVFGHDLADEPLQPVLTKELDLSRLRDEVGRYFLSILAESHRHSEVTLEVGFHLHDPISIQEI
jgi:hypothetical protein